MYLMILDGRVLFLIHFSKGLHDDPDHDMFLTLQGEPFSVSRLLSGGIHGDSELDSKRDRYRQPSFGFSKKASVYL